MLLYSQYAVGSNYLDIFSFDCLDYISSVPPVLLPLQELIALCRRYNKLILVDGAHTPGQLQLNLEQLGADFFVGSNNIQIT